jgi:hypothetical protein
MAVVIGQACTTPWHCLSAAIQNIRNVEDVSERRMLLSRWAANKKREYEYVGFAVNQNTPAQLLSLTLKVISLENRVDDLNRLPLSLPR